MQSVLDAEVARLRAMTASEKVGVMHLLWRQAWSLVSAGVRGRHPDWLRADVDVEVRRIMGGDPE
ncbi:MAG TPA: hypothetical protein VF970_10070 [Gemmatimonadales bacterium]